MLEQCVGVACLGSNPHKVRLYIAASLAEAADAAVGDVVGRRESLLGGGVEQSELVEHLRIIDHFPGNAAWTKWKEVFSCFTG